MLWSPIARLILASNLAGLVILIIGALVLNEIRSNLVQARKESLLDTTRICLVVPDRQRPRPRT
ncbi:MAG: hypothetical protein HC871_10795 [Rhizobiales bacterium]|nr:hypothetical protein [Hyphomicrobiales bacterium]